MAEPQETFSRRARDMCRQFRPSIRMLHDEVAAMPNATKNASALVARLTRGEP
jgi:hypothetical protein